MIRRASPAEYNGSLIPSPSHPGQARRAGAIWWLWAVGLVVALSAYVVKQTVWEQVFPKNFGVVVEGTIYRSGELTPSATRKVAERHGIRTIVDFGAHEADSVEERRAQRVADALGVERYVYRLSGDAQGNPNAYVRALEIMTDPEMQPVLIHCAAGSERTGCAVAMYRHVIEDVPIDEAYEETKRFKHRTHRNPHLRAMLDEWADDVERAYETGGVIEGKPNAFPRNRPHPDGDP